MSGVVDYCESRSSQALSLCPCRTIHLLSGTTVCGLPPLTRQVIIDRVPPLILGFIVAFSPRFTSAGHTVDNSPLVLINSEADQQTAYEVVVEVLRRWGGPLLLECVEGAQAMAELAGQVRSVLEQDEAGRQLSAELSEVGVTLEVSFQNFSFLANVWC